MSNPSKPGDPSRLGRQRDPLRDRLRGRDPVPDDVPVDPVHGLAARHLLESVMSTPVVPDQVHLDRPAPRRRPLVLTAAAGVLALAAAGTVWLDGRDQVSNQPAPAPRPVVLALPGTDPLTAICTPFDPAALATQPVAFAGTVTAASSGSVTLAVDRWYRGGSTPTVSVTVPAGFSAALDGVDLTVGKRYLVSANEGVVGSCGSSGEATPELTAVFDRAFG